MATKLEAEEAQVGLGIVLWSHTAREDLGTFQPQLQCVIEEVQAEGWRSVELGAGWWSDSGGVTN